MSANCPRPGLLGVGREGDTRSLSQHGEHEGLGVGAHGFGGEDGGWPPTPLRPASGEAAACSGGPRTEKPEACIQPGREKGRPLPVGCRSVRGVPEETPWRC